MHTYTNTYIHTYIHTLSKIQASRKLHTTKNNRVLNRIKLQGSIKSPKIATTYTLAAAVVQCVAVCCNVLQCVQWVAVWCSLTSGSRSSIRAKFLSLAATHCNTLHCTATLCNTLQYSAILCNTLQHAATRCNRKWNHLAAAVVSGPKCNTLLQHCNTLHCNTPHCNTLQHTATNCNALQSTASHYNTLQHTVTRKGTIWKQQ